MPLGRLRIAPSGLAFILAFFSERSITKPRRKRDLRTIGTLPTNPPRKGSDRPGGPKHNALRTSAVPVSLTKTTIQGHVGTDSRCPHPFHRRRCGFGHAPLGLPVPRQHVGDARLQRARRHPQVRNRRLRPGDSRRDDARDERHRSPEGAARKVARSRPHAYGTRRPRRPHHRA